MLHPLKDRSLHESRGASAEQDALSTEIGELLETYSTTDAATERESAWAACMRDRGYDYASPEEPALEYSDDAEVTESEISTRIADLECDSEVGMTRARSEAEAELIADWADANATRIAEIDELNTQVIDHLANRAARLHREGVDALDDG